MAEQCALQNASAELTLAAAAQLGCFALVAAVLAGPMLMDAAGALNYVQTFRESLRLEPNLEEEVLKQRWARGRTLAKLMSAVMSCLLTMRLVVQIMGVYKGKPSFYPPDAIVLYATLPLFLRHSCRTPWDASTVKRVDAFWFVAASIWLLRAPISDQGPFLLFVVWMSAHTAPKTSLWAGDLITLVRLARLWASGNPERMVYVNTDLRSVVMIQVAAYWFLSVDKAIAKHILAEKVADFHGAVRGILNARTDAVVQLTSDLKIENPTWQLQATLGGNQSQLDGASFLDFLAGDDKLRFTLMCNNSEAASPGTSEPPVAGALRMSIRNFAGAVCDASVYHVSIISRDGPPSHLLGICRDKEQPEVLAVPPAQLAAASHVRTRRGPSSNSSGRSSRSSITVDSQPDKQDSGALRVTLDAFSKGLLIDEVSDKFEEYLDIGEVDDMVTFLGRDGSKFAKWLTHRVNTALHDWTPTGFAYIRYGSVKLRSRSTGMCFRARLFVTLPDPMIGYDEDTNCYKITTSFELREQVHDAVQAVLEDPAEAGSTGT